jgi:hypothetical protein
MNKDPRKLLWELFENLDEDDITDNLTVEFGFTEGETKGWVTEAQHHIREYTEQSNERG